MIWNDFEWFKMIPYDLKRFRMISNDSKKQSGIIQTDSKFMCWLSYYSLFEHYKHHLWRVVLVQKLVKNQLSAKLWPTLLLLSWEEANIKMSLRKKNKRQKRKCNQDQRKQVRMHSVWKSPKKVAFNIASEASYVYI